MGKIYNDVIDKTEEDSANNMIDNLLSVGSLVEGRSDIKFRDDEIDRVYNIMDKSDFRSVLLVGDSGCGKHTIVNSVLSKNYGICVEDITDDISFETICNVLTCQIKKFYIIDIDRLTVDGQNKILKLVEEPSETSYLVLLTSSISTILPTIKNRCQVFTFGKYTKEELSEFCKDGNLDVLEFASTPGQVEKFSCSNSIEIANVCSKLVEFGGKFSIGTVLTFSNKIDWKNDDASKFNLDLVIKNLFSSIVRCYKNNCCYFNSYILTHEMFKNICLPHVDKKRIFEKYLFSLVQTLKRDVHSECC